MVKAWFDRLSFDIIAHIKYTRDGKPVKPYLSSVFISANVHYDGKHKWIDAMVFPQRDRIDIEFLRDGELEVGEMPVRIYDSTVKTVFNDLVNKLLPVAKKIQNKIQDEIQELINSLGSEKLPDITQTIRIDGTIFNENPYGNYIGNVNIKEYIGTGGATEHEVAEKSFEVKKSSDGELVAVEEDHGKEMFNPTYQEMLDILVPSKSEFEDLLGLIRQAIKEGKVEYENLNS
jgi:hypothetical protein